MRTTTFSAIDHIPEPVRLFASKRAAELGGAVLLGLSAILGVALASWSVQDPSLTHATAAPVRNLLGLPGAIVSDLIMQLVGLGAISVLVPMTLAGWRLLTHRRFDRLRLRIVLCLVGAVAAAALASALPVTDRWPLPTGLGGLIGDKALAIPQWLSRGSRAGLFVSLLPLFGIALLALSAASGYGLHEAVDPDEDDELDADQHDEEDESAGRSGVGVVLIGFAIHLALTFRSWFDTKWARGLPPAKPVRALKRVAEPTFDEPQPYVSEQEPEFDDEERFEAEMPASVPAAMPPANRPAPRAASPAPARPAPVLEAPPEVPSAAVVVPAAAPIKQSKRIARPDGAGHAEYELPALTLLSEPKRQAIGKISEDALEQNARLLEGVLDDFGVKGEIIKVRPGPVVTLYELEPAPGIKSSRVIGLADDVARSMSAVSARIAVVQGRNAIGIELPNQKRETVFLRELVAAEDFQQSKHKLAIALGKTIGGEAVIVDLARMPHLLVAGTTGSGKSVAINTMILSLLYRLTPQQCRLIMVDPKMLELSVYDGIPHLLTPVVTDPKKAVVALKWAVREMEDRYKKMSRVGVRNIDGFNARVAEAKSKGEVITRTVQTGYNRETGEAVYEHEQLDLDVLPYIVVIVDEMADLMLVAGKDIEGAIQRLAQMARAAGIHLIMATQRPSVDVITGTIKANFPTRISFQVTSKIDSRTILGEQGADQLLGQGDMLHMAGGGRISRVHGPFVSDGEVEKIVAHLKTQGTPDYLEAITAEDDEDGDGGGGDSGGGDFGDESGDLYDRAVAIVLRDRKCSTSYIQRRLSVGYNKAASLVERMEREGVIGQANHAGKREILVGSGIDRGAFDLAPED